MASRDLFRRSALRASPSCRAGLAGRGTPVARTTKRPKLAFPPTRDVSRVGLLAALALAAPLAAFAGAPETDPARRSLVVDAVERLSPAVVNISAEQTVVQQSPFPSPNDPLFDQFFRDFFDPRPRRSTRTSLGSGFIVNADGTILTNAHVILRGSKVHVTLVDGREFEAKLVGADADSDLAVLRIKTPDSLPTVTLGTSNDLLIGETVIAIGNPFGLSHTVTTGVVSATGRSLHGEERTYTDFVQTDASINPGNSGGPLSNIRGEVIGINAAIYGKAQGIGFAIPIDRAKRVLSDLVSYGEVKSAWIGLVAQDLTTELKRHFGVTKGVVIARVEPKSPAAAAGLVRGDVIVKIDGHPVDARDEFEGRVAAHQPGDSLSITVSGDADGVLRTVELRVVQFPDTDADALVWSLLGFATSADDNGLAVTKVRPQSPVARIGLRRGDRILGLGGTAVQTQTELRRRMIEVRSAGSIVLSVGRGPYQYNVQVPLERE
jgi:serine protease Do